MGDCARVARVVVVRKPPGHRKRTRCRALRALRAALRFFFVFCFLVDCCALRDANARRTHDRLPLTSRWAGARPLLSVAVNPTRRQPGRVPISWQLAGSSR